MIPQTHSGMGHNINAKGDVFINTLPRLASDLTTVVNTLGKRLFLSNGVVTQDSISAFDPNNKIAYNNVVKFKVIVDHYKMYVGKLTSIYSVFDSQGTNVTHIVLENIKLAYLKEKAAHLSRNPGRDEMEVIRENADDIIEGVESALANQIRISSNIEATTETINLSLQIVLIDAFIRCKILEEPPHVVA